jgi:hypothetical protein
MLALTNAMSAAGPVRQGFAAVSVAWQDLVLILVGLVLLVLALLVVHRRRRAAEEDMLEPHIPLITLPTPMSPGNAAGPVRPPPVAAEPHGDAGSATERPAAGAVDDWGPVAQAGPVRFYRPPEGTLQMLPGRLEIVHGNEGVDEIRFVRVPGREPVITFGRSAGEPHTHIELQSPTVSRNHAAMRFDRGRWHIANLSTTNPLVVRGRQLAVGDPAVRLEDGDEVEMGEVTFRFRAR